jgi:hypothetical protein
MIDSLSKLARLVSQDGPLKRLVQLETLADIHHQNETYPIYSFTIGSADPKAPVLFVTGGVHGLERIGAQLAWSLLKTTLDRLVWDQAHQELFQNIRLVIIPLVNPVGFKKFKRSNGNNVDLMRNAPIKAVERTPFLVGGQRYSDALPWFQGREQKMEDENRAVAEKFFSSTSQSTCVISMDFHSGFGMRDRIWFPFSYTKTPFDKLPEMHAFGRLFEETYPFHIYQIEPQSKSYLISGDLWDFLFLELQKRNPSAVYLPLTLEMGSWLWVRKNPWQLFSREGIFNPIKEHRLKRTYRRHTLLFDFLLKALYSHKVWSQLDQAVRNQHQHWAKEKWYE